MDYGFKTSALNVLYLNTGQSSFNTSMPEALWWSVFYQTPWNMWKADKEVVLYIQTTKILTITFIHLQVLHKDVSMLTIVVPRVDVTWKSSCFYRTHMCGKYEWQVVLVYCGQAGAGASSLSYSAQTVAQILEVIGSRLLHVLLLSWTLIRPLINPGLVNYGTFLSEAIYNKWARHPQIQQHILLKPIHGYQVYYQCFQDF